MSRRPLLSLALLLAVVISAGCGVLPEPLRTPGEGNQVLEKRLMTVRIERWGETRFSGLLALQLGEGWLRYALLDASGVKLLEAWSNSGGASQVLHAKGGIRDSGLADFLGEALIRIFFQEPLTPLCSGHWWNRLCRDNRATKSRQLGPLPWWQVESSTTSSGEETTIYRQPWIGVHLSLRALP